MKKRACCHSDKEECNAQGLLSLQQEESSDEDVRHDTASRRYAVKMEEADNSMRSINDDGRAALGM